MKNVRSWRNIVSLVLFWILILVQLDIWNECFSLFTQLIYPPIPLELRYCAETCSFRPDYGVNFSFSCDGAITWLLSCVCSSIMNQALHMCMPDEPVIYSPVRLINQKSFQHSSANLHLYNPKSLPWIGIIPHRLAPLFIPLRLILL